jgi:molybdate transport system regulatory protein
MVGITIRIDLSQTAAIGPGKIRLLECIDETGSISAAGRAMAMSYRRAWLLVEELNRLFRRRIVITKLGGKAGGGAELTPFGRSLIQHYREIESEAQDILGRHLAELGARIPPTKAAMRSRTRRSA